MKAPKKNTLTIPGHGGLYSTFQPIVDVQAKKIFAYEALIRSTKKPFHPAELFRHHYAKGSVISLDFACIRKACKALPRVRGEKLLFVNIEPMTLSQIFSRNRQGYLLLKKIIPYRRRVVFELTEGMKSMDFELVRRGVRLLRKHGCQFALDDVSGIGIKLFRLLSLKPDFIKIDISLVKNLASNRLNQMILQKLVKLATKHGALLIAEGLEKKSEVEAVKTLGIPYAQGFYFFRARKGFRR